jgi:tetratricopeptide (TPR) repeat protein
MSAPAVVEARTLLATGREADRTAARRALEGWLRENPHDDEAVDLEAQILHEVGESGRAERLLDEYLRYYPHSTLAASRLAWLYRMTGRGEEAVAELRALLARDPDCERAHRWILDWLLADRQYDTAALAGAEAVRRFPDAPWAHLAHGRALAHQGRGEAACAALKAAHDLAPADEEIARALAELFLDQNQSARAHQLLAPLAANPTAAHATRLRAAEAAFRTGLIPQALQTLDTTLRDCTDEEQASETIEILQRYMGLRGLDDLLFDRVANSTLSDAMALAFLEFNGNRTNRGNIAKLYGLIANQPLRYPRTMARFLSTYHDAPLVPGTTERWVRANRAIIDQCTHLWGGVGAWHAARGKWAEAAAHLADWPMRPDVRPWMIYLRGRALEAIGDMDSANEQYRAALRLPPDHSEPATRARLAYNLMADGMAGAGAIIAAECSPAGKALAGIEELVRLLAVETVVEARKIPLSDEREQFVRDALERLRQLARQDARSDAGAVVRDFQRRLPGLLRPMDGDDEA